MTTHGTIEPLEIQQLNAPVSEADFTFDSTTDLPASEDWVGQNRAVDAIQMSATIDHSDFNVFVLGSPGSGRRRIIRSILNGAAKQKARPSDWVYVNNFQAPDKPIAIELPPGDAIWFRKAMEDLVDELANDIPALFESEDYHSQRSAIDQKFAESHEAALGQIFENAREREVAILRSPIGFTVAGKFNDDVMTTEKFDTLDEKQREEVEAAIAKTQEELAVVLKSFPVEQKLHRKQIETLNYNMAAEGVDEAISSVMAAFSKLEAVQIYLKNVRLDLIENAELFLMPGPGAEGSPFPVATTKHYAKPQFTRYAVNVIVSHKEDSDLGTPIVEETLPLLANLIGRIEFESTMGALATDFSMIKPGALHAANGGYLILDARQILTEPFAWDALKQSLKTAKISIYSPGDRLSLVSTVTLTPAPIPLKVRVVLVGERWHYYLLQALDPDFKQLFKLEADFNDDIEADKVSDTETYAKFLGTLAKQLPIRPLAPCALVRMFKESARIANDVERLTLNVGKLSDIMREADYWANAENRDIISGEDIERTISEIENRAGRVRDLSHDAILRETMLIDTGGEKVGQVNALSVLQVGNYSFGRPSRVTARTRMGNGKVIDIEREVELGGPIHSKGMLILQSYLATTFATDAPMSLWASIVFEQSYGGVDGDSASAAELLALLSSLADVPIDQSFAMTGSINQFGEIQAIGGVNEKIEGFFDICSARGLTEKQGVLIPASNVKNLGLRPRVVDAVETGEFKIYPMQTISDAIEIMTGLPAGARSAKGHFPKKSLNWKVENQLRTFAKNLNKFKKSGAAGELK